MSPRDVSERKQRAALEAYRDAACAEADAHFDERTLEAQRHKILARIANLGHTAKVIRFPLASHIEAPGSSHNRRWIAAAAAGLIIGVLGGQFVHLLPSSTRRLAPASETIGPASGPSASMLPTLVTYSPDDGLLDEVDFAVQVRSAAELRALDELTPFHDPR